MVGFLPFSDCWPTFAIPLFNIGPERKLCVQEIDEISDSISSFSELEGDTQNFVAFKHDQLVSVGGKPIYAFCASQEAAHVGRLNDLIPALKHYLSITDLAVSVRLQISELIGTKEEKRSARISMRRFVFSETGESTAREFYEESLRSAVWDRLATHAVNPQAKARILSARSRVSVVVGKDDQLSLHHPGLDSADYSASQSDILKEVEAEFGKFSDTLPLAPLAGQDPQFEGSWYDLSDTDRATAQSYISRIVRAGNQEERIALLLTALLANRAIGIHVLQLYAGDRAKYAHHARNELLKALAPNSEVATLFVTTRHNDISDRELIEIVWRCYSYSMPRSRAFLFYFIAKHASAFPQANAFLRYKLAASRSQFLNHLKPEIKRFLNEAAG